MESNPPFRPYSGGSPTGVGCSWRHEEDGQLGTHCHACSGAQILDSSMSLDLGHGDGKGRQVNGSKQSGPEVMIGSLSSVRSDTLRQHVYYVLVI